MKRRTFRIGAAGIVLLLAAVLFAVQATPRTDTLTGKVVSIADGDTLTMLVGKVQRRVRLHGIDCPERKQPFGTKARKFASDLAFGKTVSVRVMDRDRYGRTVGVVLLPDGGNLNHALVTAGLAWWYRKYAPTDKTLARLEAEARKAKRGLWADPKAMPPWEWRQSPRAKQKTDKPPADASGKYRLNTVSNVRHNSSCRYEPVQRAKTAILGLIHRAGQRRAARLPIWPPEWPRLAVCCVSKAGWH